MIEGHRDRVLLRTTPAGLILTGGGARAAYQVGVLKGIAAVLRDTRRGLDPGIAQGHNPFQILVGIADKNIGHELVSMFCWGRKPLNICEEYSHLPYSNIKSTQKRD